MHLLCAQAEGGGDNVERLPGTLTVDEDHGAAVGRRVVEAGEAGYAIQSLRAATDGARVTAEVDIFARERTLVRERGNPTLVDRGPEVDGLSSDEDELPLEVRQFCEHRPDVGVAESAHSSGLVPRRSMNTSGNAK